jgi:hypothetical protein
MKKTNKTKGGKVVPTPAKTITGILATVGRAINNLIPAVAAVVKAQDALTAAREKAVEIVREIKAEVTTPEERTKVAKHVYAALIAAPYNLKKQRASEVLASLGLAVRRSSAKGLQIDENNILQMITLAESLEDKDADRMAALVYKVQSRVRKMKAAAKK